MEEKKPTLWVPPTFRLDLIESIRPSVRLIYLIVLEQMLSHIAFLSKSFSTKLAYKWFNAEVHPEVVEEVPSSHELLPTPHVLTSVNDDCFPILSVFPVL